MEKLYLFAPQWQDSGITRELYEGAWALRRYVEEISAETFLEISIDTAAIPVVENNILGYSIINDQLERIRATLARYRPDKIFTLGGGCGIEIPIVSYLFERHGDLTVFWFDAHGDLNSPASSPSKHFHGMPLRFLLERQDGPIGEACKILPSGAITLIGARDLDPPETDFIKTRRLKLLEARDPDMQGKIATMAGERIGAAYIHIDLDVIDPKHYRNVKCPTKDGMGIEDLVKAIGTIKKRRKVVGYSIAENTEKKKNEIRRLEELVKLWLNF